MQHVLKTMYLLFVFFFFFFFWEEAEMRVFGWRDAAALAAGLGAMCLCTLLVSHASQRTTLVADDFAWNRGTMVYFCVSGVFARSQIYYFSQATNGIRTLREHTQRQRLTGIGTMAACTTRFPCIHTYMLASICTQTLRL